MYVHMYISSYKHVCIRVYACIYAVRSLSENDPGTQPLQVNSVTAPEGTARVWRKLAMAMVPLALIAVAYHHSKPG